MKSILLQKLYTTYGSFSNISSRIKEYNLLRIKRNGTIPLFNLAKHEGLLDKIKYTYEDFIIDFENDIKGYKETKILFKIWCLRYNIKDYAKFIGVSYSTLSSGFINGFIGSTLLEATATIFDEKDIVDLKLDFGEGYCKLIGSNERLVFIREKYKREYPILSYKDKLNHIAFDGPFYNYLKNIYSCN